jgi:dihydroflavonol-4-reductase
VLTFEWMVLVTGASGFLGGHLVKRLSLDGCSIRALYHRTPPSHELTSHVGVEWMQVDLLDVYQLEDALAGISHVYHCAAIISFHQVDHAAMLHFNVEATANVVNASLNAGVEKLVYVSSIAAIGTGANQGSKMTNEDEPWGEAEYKTAYGLSKHLAEIEVWRGYGEGLSTVIVNPGVILGEGDWTKGSSELMTIAWDQFPFYTKGVTAWVDVHDVVTAMVALMAAPIEGERFVLSEDNYSYQDVLTMMAKALNRKPPTTYAGKLLTSIIWRFGSIKSLFGKRAAITRESAGNAHRVTRYDNSKLLKSLQGFSYTPILHTIGRMATHFLQHKTKNI